VSERARAVLTERRDRISAADLLRMLAAIGDLELRFRKSGQQQLLLETLMVRFALLDRSVVIEDLIRGLGEGPSQSGGAARQSGQSFGGSTGRASAPSAEPQASETRPSTIDRGPTAGDRPVVPPIVRDQPARPRAEPDWSSATRSTPSSSVATQAAPTAAAPARQRNATGVIPSINLITERWDDIVASLASTRMLLAPFLEQAVPSALSAAGVLTVRAEDEAAADALEMAKADMLAVVQGLFPAVERVVVGRPNGPSVSGSHRRVTEEEIREQRITSLRKRDPVLGAAIDALDLELLD